LLSERPDLAKKLAIDLILREQAWFPIHVDTREIGLVQLYDKCFQENISIVKNYILRLNLVQSSFSSRIQFESNWSEGIRSGTSVKGFLVNINSAIDPSTYKEIGTMNYWINNCLEI
jgi:hypothetical protein